jgi:signal transduction histidine kinase
LAANNDGVWSQQPASFSFDIPPTFFQSKWFLVTCFVASVALILCFYFYQIRQMAHAIKIRLHERFEERERIARELHDTLIQGFQGLVLRFDAIHRQIPFGLADVRRDMEDAISRAEEVISEGRDRVGDIRVDAGQPHDLAQALSHIQDEIALETQAHLEVQTSQARPISSIARDEVYRIGREGILNAFRHSHATLISVHLDYADDGLVLEVKDNGLGINPQLAKDGAKPGHWGLPGMRERAKRLGASLTISADQGTKICLRVPASACYPRRSFLAPLCPAWLRKMRRSRRRPEHL